MSVTMNTKMKTAMNATMNEYLYDEIKLSNEYAAAFSVQITQELMDEFMSLSGDTNPLHIDSEFAKTVGGGYSQTELFTVCLLLLFIRVLQAYIFPESIVYFRG